MRCAGRCTASSGRTGGSSDRTPSSLPSTAGAVGNAATVTLQAAAAGQVSTDYWVTVATVVPVLALALVFEVRVLSQRWSEHTPSWVMVMQAAFWAALLATFAFLLPAAMRGVRGEDMPSWLPGFSETIVSWCVAILLIGPAAEIFV